METSNPADVDLLTFMIFEAAFVSICAAYLFGGLVKDRIAASYEQASLTDPLTGVANHRGFFQMGERLLMRTRFERPAVRTDLCLISIALKASTTVTGIGTGDEVLIAFCRSATSHLRYNRSLRPDRR